MNFKRLLLAGVMFSAALLTLLTDSRSAKAQETFTVARTYTVEVKYWFFDTDYYYWSTVLETDKWEEANLLYDILSWAKSNGDLNTVVPHMYWRYIAVDVRMQVKYHWPWMQPSLKEPLMLGD